MTFPLFSTIPALPFINGKQPIALDKKIQGQAYICPYSFKSLLPSIFNISFMIIRIKMSVLYLVVKYLISKTFCRYANGQSFLADRYSREHTENIFNGILDEDLNLGITFAFTLGMIVFNLFLYLIPIPAFVKAKFRE